MCRDAQLLQLDLHLPAHPSPDEYEGALRCVEALLRGERRADTLAQRDRWVSLANSSTTYAHQQVREHGRAAPPVGVVRLADGRETASASEALGDLEEYWHGLCRSNPATAGRWDAFRAKYGEYFPPPVPFAATEITADALAEQLSRLPRAKAGGVDGWRVAEIRALPYPFLEYLAAILRGVEARRQWPGTLLQALVQLVPKDASGRREKHRPITVMPVIYRLWSGLRLQDAMRWQERWARERLGGYRLRRGTTRAVWEMAAELEQGHIRDEVVMGILFDLQKCFDRIPTDIALRLLQETGLPEPIAATLQAMYMHLRRRLRYDGAVGKEFEALCGILQGCPLSVVVLNVLLNVLLAALEDGAPAARAYNYADDVAVTAGDAAALQQATQIVEAFAADTGQALHTGGDKCSAFATAGPDPGVELCGARVQRTTDFAHVGAGHVAGGTTQACSRTVRQRIADGKRRAEGIAALPIPFEKKAELVAAQVIPAALYGAHACHVPKEALEELRQAILRAIWPDRRRRCKEVVLNVLCKGHRVDPVVVVPYMSIMALAQTFNENEGQRPWIWEALSRKRKQHPKGTVKPLQGPVAAAKNHLRTAGFTYSCDAGGTVTLHREGCAFQLADVELDLGRLGHAVRAGLKQWMWRTIVGHRDSMAGIEEGIDIQRTNALWERRGRELDLYEAGVLRGIIGGASFLCGTVQHQWGFQATATCAHCDAGTVDDHEHMWWHCAKHADVREKYPELMAADRGAWPAALTINAVVPANWMSTKAEKDARDRLVEQLQNMMVDITMSRSKEYLQRRRDQQTAHRADPRDRLQFRKSTFDWDYEPVGPVRRFSLEAVTWTAKRFLRSQRKRVWQLDEQTVHCFQRWWALLEWPAEGQRKTPVSMIELLLDFALHSGCKVGAEHMDIAGSARAFSSLIHRFEELMPRGTRWHDGQRKANTGALHGLGGPDTVAGYTSRPKLVCQEQTFVALRELMRKVTSRNTKVARSDRSNAPEGARCRDGRARGRGGVRKSGGCGHPVAVCGPLRMPA
eukprot:TRINITY_DN1064_c0_g1_i3.p1 TRINITY_DN1064_c0_g1~~TRINITY_DN1064_c0_g1_i3.p1  ORF type:complete len:1033 (+),score=216.88 TRINITY_DN1064_c0_g1_i3:170-3268(+)